MIEAVLFDLDGTLLKHHVEDFLNRYFGLIQHRFGSIFPDGKLVELILKSTKKMLANNGKKTNKEVFWEDFLKEVDFSQEQLEPMFSNFYRNDFQVLKGGVEPDPSAQRTLIDLKENGYKLALATNSLFPEVAVVERLRWAGLDREIFDFLATYEVMHFCKPDPSFFLEVADKLGVKPENCLMVGNEVELDLIPAAQVGMKTFLVKNGFEVLTQQDFDPDAQGELTELPFFLENWRAG